MIIIALVGMPKAGKGVISGALEGRGYMPISMSAILREQILRDYPNDPNRRDDMFARAVEYRRQCGPGYLGELSMSRVFEASERGKDKFVIDGIRHPAELDIFLSSGAVPAGIICDYDKELDYAIRKKRFMENAHQRGMGFESTRKFRSMNDREWSNEDPMAPQIGACLSIVVNHRGRLFINGEGKKITELQNEVNQFASSLEGAQSHPERR